MRFSKRALTLSKGLTYIVIAIFTVPLYALFNYRRNTAEESAVFAGRRQVECVAVAVLGVLVACGIEAAQSYPNRPLRIIVPFPPGGAPDIVARILGNKLTDQFGQQVIVEQRPGASGIIGVQIAKTAAPDGYTLLLVGTTLFSTLPALKPQLSYDPDADFIALSRVASAALVIAVHPSVAVNTVAELVKLARARPGQLNYGSGGNGTTGHIAGEM